MNPIQAAADPSPYLTPHETLLHKSRHHPVVVAIPLVQATIAAVLIVAATIAAEGPAVVAFGLAIALLSRFAKSTRRIPFILVWLISTIGLVGVTSYGNGGPLAVIFLVGALLYVLWGAIDYLVTWVFLTDKRVFRVNGVITRRVASLPLRAMTDIRYDRPLLGRYLGYGHFVVESAGQDQALSKLRYIGRPDGFYGSVMEEALGRSISSNTLGTPGQPGL